MKKTSSLILILFLLASYLVSPAPVSAAGYSYYRSITIDHTKAGSSNSTNFPVLISGTYAYLATVANSGKVQNSSGYDVIFTSDSACSTKLNWETETYTAVSGLVNYWVQVPTLSSTVDTVIYMCYGNSSISTDQSNKTGTWDTNYKGVWHLPNGSTLTANDSTSNANNGTLVNTPTATAGQIDGGAAFVAASSQNITATVSQVSGSTKATLSGWLKRSAINQHVSFGPDANAAGTNRYNVGADSDGRIYVTAANGSVQYASLASNDTNWHQITTVYDGSLSGNARLIAYLDGTLTTLTYTGTPDASLGNATFYIGRDLSSGGVGHYTDGSIDEVRVSTGIARSADWVTAEYNNQNSPSTFYTVGAETNVAVASPSTHTFLLFSNFMFLFKSGSTFLFW